MNLINYTWCQTKLLTSLLFLNIWTPLLSHTHTHLPMTACFMLLFQCLCLSSSCSQWFWHSHLGLKSTKLKRETPCFWSSIKFINKITVTTLTYLQLVYTSMMWNLEAFSVPKWTFQWSRRQLVSYKRVYPQILEWGRATWKTHMRLELCLMEEFQVDSMKPKRTTC